MRSTFFSEWETPAEFLVLAAPFCPWMNPGDMRRVTPSECWVGDEKPGGLACA
ncbi:MAG: hypothetical protein KJ578_10380 [Bacteroidetes bacterium]|nr:hypothetical protein [Bacteroidota bacterium]MBU2558172.1 hypothetical protein [Bacteroidota bacterium]